MEKKLTDAYYDCKEEVKELERLLFESRLRYRKNAKKMKKQSYSDYFREWYEWIINKEAYVNNELRKVREEKRNESLKEESVKSFGMNSFYGLIKDKEDTFLKAYESYNACINEYDENDYEVDEI